jgi:DNA-binding NtrC family response regulator
MQLFQADPADFVILDRNLPDADGLVLLEQIVRESRERGLDSLVVVATAYATVDSAVQALKAGAFDYLPKPIGLSELIVTFRRALDARKLRVRARQLSIRQSAAVGDLVVGSSASMRQVLGMVEKVSEAVDTTVLIQGESGTGKELVANLIHRRTPGRCEQQFVEFNCSALPDSLLEAELFGYERGAFTDARAKKRGLFEAAEGGTLFLDEIGEMHPSTQTKLLKVLEEMTFRRLGGTRDIKVNVRVIAATNKDLAAEVTRGAFRLDLYHRLDVFHLQIPALRERSEDVIPLARHFLAKLSVKLKKPGLTFAPEAEQRLRSHDYAGNVRELRNIIERAVILAARPVIGPECIVLSGPRLPDGARATFFTVDLDANDQVPTWDDVERWYVASVYGS